MESKPRKKTKIGLTLMRPTPDEGDDVIDIDNNMDNHINNKSENPE